MSMNEAWGGAYILYSTTCYCKNEKCSQHSPVPETTSKAATWCKYVMRKDVMKSISYGSPCCMQLKVDELGPRVQRPPREKIITFRRNIRFAFSFCAYWTRCRSLYFVKLFRNPQFSSGLHSRRN